LVNLYEKVWKSSERVPATFIHIEKAKVKVYHSVQPLHRDYETRVDAKLVWPFSIYCGSVIQYINVCGDPCILNITQL